jgi:hypothetical protein
MIDPSNFYTWVNLSLLNLKSVIMKKLSRYVLVLFSFYSCQAQINQDNQKENNLRQIVKPKGKWKVNKKFDENGNLIQYDSIYTYSYSVNNLHNSNQDLDSIINKFKKNFQQDLSNPFNSMFFNMPEDDSFFDKDYYLKNWKKNNFDMSKMMKEMDSIKNIFLDDCKGERVFKYKKEKNKQKQLKNK